MLITLRGVAEEEKAPELARGDASAKKPRSNLAIRLLTVLALGPLLLLLLFWGPAWGWAVLICLSAGQAAREFLAMTHPADRSSRLFGAGLTICLSALLYWGSADPRILFTAVVVLVVAGAFVPLVRLGEIPTAALRMLGGIAAPLYVGFLLTCLALLRRDLGEEGPWYVFLALTIAWMGDTGGYTFGRLFGKTPLYLAVSPKKTREGLLGSLVFSTLVGLLAGVVYLESLPPLHGALLGFFGAALGQAGDLVESLLKRSTGVKDSGSILPGHGGLLDRIDALLVVGALVYVYALWAVPR